MSIDVVSLRDFPNSTNAIDIAFPVLAYECEVNTLLDSELDAYEEAALKLISIGLSEKGVAKSLKIPESLAKQVLCQLENNKFASKQTGHQWELTEDGRKYLKGIRKQRFSNNGRFGFIFVSAIKKDVLQYFYEGSLGKIARSDSEAAKNKLTLDDGKLPFSGERPKRWKVEQAYKRYLRILELEYEQENNKITIQEAQDVYADYETFDEYEYDEPDNSVTQSVVITEPEYTKKSFVRLLKRPPKDLYLNMRIVISPEKPGGFTVYSPLDLGGIDDEFFQRQIQWIKEYSEPVYFANKKLTDVIDSEVSKLSRQKSVGEKDKSVYILEQLPLLATEKNRYSVMYRDVAEIYGLMCETNLSRFKRESIIGGFSRKLFEALMNKLIHTTGGNNLRLIKDKVLSDINCSGTEKTVSSIAKIAGINCNTLQGDGDIFKKAISKLDGRYGNSVLEKLFNILTVNAYCASVEIKRFIYQDNLDEYIEVVRKINRIRNRASHEAESKITSIDYDFYIEQVFGIANRLLESLKEVSQNGSQK
ncbi:MAG: hypothetical protein LBH05_02195 [Deferribacteraceae bacterium]|nr:hypothetical protein [Deferribacteraceae bacterium]